MKQTKPSLYEKFRFFWGAFVISSIIAVFMIPAIIIFPKKKGKIMHRLNKLILKLMGIKLKQTGQMDKTADMYIMNHQGIIDIIGMEALQDRHLRWAAKKELFSAPWFGLLLRHADMLKIDRESKSALVSLLKGTKESLYVLKRPVGIFPEGTRAEGQSLLPFKEGAKIVAEKLGLKVQPVVIIGSKHVLNEHNKTGHSGTVEYIFLPTVDVSNAAQDWYEKMRSQMQKEIDDAHNNTRRSR